MIKINSTLNFEENVFLSVPKIDFVFVENVFFNFADYTFFHDYKSGTKKKPVLMRLIAYHWEIPFIVTKFSTYIQDT